MKTIFSHAVLKTFYVCQVSNLLKTSAKCQWLIPWPCSHQKNSWEMKSLAILHLFSCPEGKFQVPLISKSPPGEIWAPQITSSAFVHKLNTFYNYTKIYNGWVREKNEWQIVENRCQPPMLVMTLLALGVGIGFLQSVIRFFSRTHPLYIFV